MTNFGKVLVYLNVFVAVVLFGWAMSLYTNRVDWFDRTPAGGEKIEGQFTQLKAEVDRLNAQIETAQLAYGAASYRLAMDAYVNSEVDRDYRNAIYFNRLNEIKRSDDSVRFRVLLREKKSALLDVANEGPVISGLNLQPLMSLGALNTRFKDLLDETIRRKETIRKYRADYAALSDQISLVQDEVLRQKLIFDNLKDEQGYLRDSRINWEEQLRTLELRKSQLQARLETLGASPKVSRADGISTAPAGGEGRPQGIRQ